MTYYPPLPVLTFSTFSAFPASAQDGTVGIALDTDYLYVYNLATATWILTGTQTTGTVTSVGLSDLSTTPIYTVSGSPVTTSGTLHLTLNTQSANKVFAGPTTGSAAQPTFRSLVAADIPSLSSTYLEVANNLSDVASAATSFANISPLTTKGDLIYEGTSAPARLAIGSTGNVLTVSGGVPTWAAPATSGTVTSVAMTVPSFLSISGSPITSSGTLAISLSGTALPVANGGTGLTSGTSGGVLAYTASGTLASSGALTANQLVIGGGAGAAPSTLAAGSQYQVLVMGASNPGYGALNLSQSAAITGTLPIGNGGTGQTTAAAAFNALNPMTTTGDIIYESGTNTASRLAVGSTGNVLTVSGGVPTWAAPATSGTVTSVAMTVPAFLSIGGSPITSTGTLALSYSGTALPIANGGTGQTSVTSTPAASSWAGWDSNSNLSANVFIPNMTSTATAGSLITLTAASSQIQILTGSSTATVKLPAGPATGFTFTIINQSSGVVTVESSGANSIQAMASNTTARFVCVTATGTTAASWAVEYVNSSEVGTVTSVAMTVPTFLSIGGSPITSSGTLAITLSGTALPVANGGTGITSFGTGIATWLGTPSSANLLSAMTTSTGSGNLVFGTSPTVTGGTLTDVVSLGIRDTSAAYDVTIAATSSTTATAARTVTIDTQNASNTIKIPPLSNFSTLADGAPNTVLSTLGSGSGYSWVSALSSSLNQYNVSVGNSSNVATSLATNLIGDISASVLSQSYTVTHASPGVFTVTTAPATGTKAYVTVTQNGYTANTTYYVYNVSSTTFQLCTTLANALAGTGINSTNNTAGIVVSGGLAFPSTPYIGGLTQFGTGLTLPTSGGTAATLAVYEENSLSSGYTWGNTSAGPSSYTIAIVMIGKHCTARISFAGITCSGGPITISTISSRFRPSVAVQMAGGYVAGSSLGYPASVTMTTGGVISIYKDDTNNFSNGDTASATGMIISWIVL